MSPIEYLYYILGSIATLVAISAGTWRFILHYRGRRGKELPPAAAVDIVPIEEPLSWEEVYKGVGRLSEKIVKEYKPDLIVGISSGGAIVGGMLSRLLDTSIAQITRSNPRLEETKPSNSITTFLPEVIMRGKKILLVDDVIRSGRTLHKYYKEIEEGGIDPSGIKSACLVLSGEHWLKEPDFYIYRASKVDLRMPWDYHKIRR